MSSMPRCCIDDQGFDAHRDKRELRIASQHNVDFSFALLDALQGVGRFARRDRVDSLHSLFDGRDSVVVQRFQCLLLSFVPPFVKFGAGLLFSTIPLHFESALRLRVCHGTPIWSAVSKTAAPTDCALSSRLPVELSRQSSRWKPAATESHVGNGNVRTREKQLIVGGRGTSVM